VNARQAAAMVIDAARPVVRAAGTVGLLVGLAVDLVRAGLVHRAEARRIRLVDRRKKE